MLRVLYVKEKERETASIVPTAEQSSVRSRIHTTGARAAARLKATALRCGAALRRLSFSSLSLSISRRVRARREPRGEREFAQHPCVYMICASHAARLSFYSLIPSARALRSPFSLIPHRPPFCVACRMIYTYICGSGFTPARKRKPFLNSFRSLNSRRRFSSRWGGGGCFDD